MRKKRYIIPGVILFVIVLAFKHVLFIGYVPSESMEPTLKAGSYIIGSRIYGELKTGDIIIFEHDGKMLVKRIAATAGERITENGFTYIVPKGSYFVMGDNRIIHLIHEIGQNRLSHRMKLRLNFGCIKIQN